jgi:TPP-dependent pyruvate/acetoin dehydrogenase alpha subunit
MSNATHEVEKHKVTTPHGAGISEAERLRIFRMMVEIRYVLKRANDLFLQNLVKGTMHLGLGQEAVAVGFAARMNKDDYSFCTYRGHHHTLARGASMVSVLGELMGRQCGLMKGKGGSMHLTDVERGVMGSYAIVGAHLPVAAGAAWSAQYRGTKQVAVAFFGDGASNIGAFHESLNLAAVLKLPVIFVCENNLYMEYTPISSVTAVRHPAADRAAGYGLEKIVIDGNNVDDVYRIAGDAFAKARGGGGPSLIECLTYRQGGHSRADPAKYRPPEEVAGWLKRDPIVHYRKQLLELGIAEQRLTEIEEDSMAKVEQATEAAKASPTPALESAMTDVWADGGSAWHN